MTEEYHDLIFTKHAINRKLNRSISNNKIFQTIHFPDQKIRIKQSKWKFIKTFNNRPVHIVAKELKEKNKWLIISLWVRGEDDKTPFVWQILTLPFKIIFWIFKTIWQAFFHHS